MTRQRNKKQMVVSSISDEQLAILIAEDYKRSPDEFSPTISNGIINPREFLLNTSARGINPMKKWL